MGTEERVRPGAAAGRCVVCEQPHALGISYRCAGCDGEVCALCVAFVGETREPWCAACLLREEG